MIIKSFFRKKTTKIYLALISIMSVFITIFVFCIYYLNSILIQHESERLVFFENYNSKYAVNEACALVNVQNEGIKELLEEYELNNKTIIKFSNKLADKDASIIFTKNTEIQNKIKSIGIYNESNSVRLNIHTVIKEGNYNYILVSKNTFDKFWNKKSYCVSENKYKKDGTNEVVLENITYSEEKMTSDIQKKIDILTFFLYVTIFITSIILIIIVRNIKVDLKKDNLLLHILGINPLTIQLYNLINLLSLFILPIALIILLLIIIH